MPGLRRFCRFVQSMFVALVLGTVYGGDIFAADECIKNGPGSGALFDFGGRSEHVCGGDMCLNCYSGGDYDDGHAWAYTNAYFITDVMADYNNWANEGKDSPLTYYIPGTGELTLDGIVSNASASENACNNIYGTIIPDNTMCQMASNGGSGVPGTNSITYNYVWNNGTTNDYESYTSSFCTSCRNNGSILALPELPMCHGYKYVGHDARFFDGYGVAVGGTSGAALFNSWDGSITIGKNEYDLYHLSNVVPLPLEVGKLPADSTLYVVCSPKTDIADSPFCTNAAAKRYLSGIPVGDTTTVSGVGTFVYVNPLAAFMMSYTVPRDDDYFSTKTACAGKTLLECFETLRQNELKANDWGNGFAEVLRSYTQSKTTDFMRVVFANDNLSFSNTQSTTFAPNSTEYQLIKLANQYGMMQFAEKGELAFCVCPSGASCQNEFDDGKEGYCVISYNLTFNPKNEKSSDPWFERSVDVQYKGALPELDANWTAPTYGNRVFNGWVYAGDGKTYYDSKMTPVQNEWPYESDAELTADWITLGTINATVQDNVKTYDGDKLDCVGIDDVSPGDAVIQYAIKNKGICGTYSYTPPSRTDVGTTTVCYKITRDNYATKTGEFSCTVNPATMSPTLTLNTKTYDGTSLTCYPGSQTGVPDGSTITYSMTEDGEYSANPPVLTDIGSKWIYYKITNPNYDEVTGRFRCWFASGTINITWANGGHGTAPTDPASCEYDSTVTMPAAMTETGYIFDKWNVNGKTFNAGQTVACDYTNFGIYDGNVTITGSWTQNTTTDSTVVCSLLNKYLTGHGRATYANSYAPYTPVVVTYGSTLSDPYPDGYKLNTIGACRITSLTCDTGYHNVEAGVLSNYVLQPIDGEDIRYKAINKQTTECTYAGANCDYGNQTGLSAGEFEVKWDDNTMVHGTSKCTNVLGTGSQVGNPGDENGQYCWCAMTGYNLQGGALVTVPSPSWVYRWNLSEYDGCIPWCAKYCAESTRDYSRFRAGLFGAYGANPMCVADTTTVTLNKNTSNSDSTVVATVTATYDSAMPGKDVNGNDLVAPERDGYVFKGFYDARSGGTQYYTSNMTSAKVWDKVAVTQTLYAHWNDKVSCNPGYYYSATQRQCSGCPRGFYCNGFTDVEYTGEDIGKDDCPSPYDESDELTSDIDMCYEVASDSCSTINPWSDDNATSISYATSGAVTYRKYFGLYYNGLPPEGILLENIGACAVSLICNHGYHSTNAGPLSNYVIQQISDNDEYNAYRELDDSKSLNPAGLNLGEYKMFWADNTQVRAMAKCSTTVVSEDEIVATGTFPTQDTISTTDGQYCWCKMTGYNIAGANDVSVAASPWVGLPGFGYTSASQCKNSCTQMCVNFTTYPMFRTILFGSYGAYPKCETDGITLNYDLNYNNAPEMESGMCTIGGTFIMPQVPVNRTGYAFIGWQLQE